MSCRHGGWRGLIGALILAGAPGSNAATVCQTMDLPVPATSEGLYLNLVTGVSGPTEGLVPGFDVDIYAAVSTEPTGQLRFYWGPASSNGAGVASAGDVYAVLGSGHTIGSGSLFTRAAFLGDTSAWQAGTTGRYLGLRFQDEAAGNGLRYGWLQLDTTASLGFPATIRGWCFEDSGAAITTPDPDLLLRNGFEG